MCFRLLIYSLLKNYYLPRDDLVTAYRRREEQFETGEVRADHNERN